jgi:hypothetical protein
MGALYGDYLFHGPLLQGIRRIEGCSAEGIAASAKVASAPAAWIKRPLRRRWLADPMALDCAFQLMVVWSCIQRKAASLPCYARSYRQYRTSFPAEGVHIRVSVTSSDDHRAMADIEFIDESGSLVARMEGYECIIDTSLEKAFRNNRLTAPV